MLQGTRRVRLVLLVLLGACAAVGCGTTDDGRSGGAMAAPGPSPAAPVELTEAATLDDLVAYAEQYNPAVRAARDRWQAALEAERQARSLPDPKLSYGHYAEAVETRVGPQRWNATVSQTFPWFGTLRLRGNAALDAAQMAQEQHRATRLKVVMQLKTAYYDYYYLGRAIAVTDENVQLVSGLEEVVREAYTGGRAPHAAVIRVQIELEKLRDRLRALNDQRGPAAARLNALLGRDAAAPVPLPATLAAPGAPAQADELLDELASANPELRALDAAVARASRAVSLSRKARYPDLTLGVTYISTDDAVMPGVADSGKDPVIAMLSVNVPVWSGKNRAAEREARARLESAIAERLDRENVLAAELEMIVFKHEDALRKAALYGETLVPQAEQSLNVTRQAFAAGEADYLDLIDAQRTLLDLQLLAERALADGAQAAAMLDMALGREPRPAGENTAAGNQPGADGVEK